jgi:predicted ribosomally synthesized peptide with SipW-like signal peptide
MSDKPIQLSRRKALAALGTIGVASAGAGLGTTAYFSDREEFNGNKLVAGSLDLKVDWEEHYSDWSDDEAASVSDIVMTDNDPANIPGGYVGMPNPYQPLIAIPEDDVQNFQDATAIEAMPDLSNDGIQDSLMGVDVCATDWDTPGVLDPRNGPRTNNGATEDVTFIPDGNGGGDPAPLIYLNDVKPGDFGELTLSMHLCDNPGYLWLTGALRSASENGTTEPELNDPEEDAPTGTEVELLDAIQTMFWYDEDGDNVYEPADSGGKVDVMLVIDNSGSMDNDSPTTKLDEAKAGAEVLANQLGADDRLGLVAFNTDPSLRYGLMDPTVDNDGTNDNDGVSDAVEGIRAIPTSPGFTNIDGGLTLAEEELVDNGRADAVPIVVLLSDGIANRSYENGATTPSGNHSQNAVDSANRLKSDPPGARVFSIAYDVLSGGPAETTLMNIASPDSFFEGVEIGSLGQVFSQIAKTLKGEKCFLAGSLGDVLDLLSQSAPGSGAPGVPLDGDRSTDYVEVTGGDTDNDGVPDSNLALGDPSGDGRDCFVNSTTQHIGFAWYLPVDHANEIQTDSVSFDLGFYTEQCRHNDGSGQPPE